MKITYIKEIKEIYKSSDPTKDYIYYLDTDGDDIADEWSSTKTSDYSLVFNTDWITKPGTTAQLGSTSLYYFEIPVNAGEFALGSVKEKTGAYLLYLDIAANAQLIDRAAVTEDFEEITKTYEYPVGVTFRNTAITGSDPVIPSAAASIPVGNSGTYTVTVTDDTHITLSPGTVNFISDGVTVNNTLGIQNIPAAPKNTTTKKIRRTTYYDYNVSKDQYTVTVVETTKIDSGQISVTINAWNTGNDWDITAGQGVTKIADMTNGFTPNIRAATNNVEINPGGSQTLDYVEVDETNCYLINIDSSDDAQTLRIDPGAFDSDLTVENELYQFCYAIKDNSSPTEGSEIAYYYNCDISLNPDADDDNGLYAFSNRNYAITVTTSESITTRVITNVTDNNYTVTVTVSP